MPDRLCRAKIKGEMQWPEVGGADANKTEKLGYLGLGMMGFPMTRRLIDAGHDVTVWNRSAGQGCRTG